MMWFKLKGDARLGRCDSDGCGGQPTWRLEADGRGANYCSGCRNRISLIDAGLEMGKMRKAIERVVTTFEKDEAQGFRSRDRQFAIEILRSVLPQS